MWDGTKGPALEILLKVQCEPDYTLNLLYCPSILCSFLFLGNFPGLGRREDWKIPGGTSSWQSERAACPRSTQGNSAQMRGGETSNHLPSTTTTTVTNNPNPQAAYRVNMHVWQEKLQNSASELKELCKEIKKRKEMLRKTEQELQQSEEVQLKHVRPFYRWLNAALLGPLVQPNLDISVSPGAFEGRKSEAPLTPSDGKSWGSRYQGILRGQDQVQEAAAGHSHLGEEGQDCSGIFSSLQIRSGSLSPTFLFCPTSSGSFVAKHSTALLCLVQMTSRTSANAAKAAACTTEGAARPAGCQNPVKLPLLSQHR